MTGDGDFICQKTYLMLLERGFRYPFIDIPFTAYLKMFWQRHNISHWRHIAIVKSLFDN